MTFDRIGRSAGIVSGLSPLLRYTPPVPFNPSGPLDESRNRYTIRLPIEKSTISITNLGASASDDIVRALLSYSGV
ncbi:MAG: hypothetical protein KatS3mg052_0081 [Candidatus Roseilinea sp.]|nr:MAG: hypothetical protein KatS3mg052_0081 [Candidatus Roseilinea sp.]